MKIVNINCADSSINGTFSGTSTANYFNQLPAAYNIPKYSWLVSDSDQQYFLIIKTIEYNHLFVYSHIAIGRLIIQFRSFDII